MNHSMFSSLSDGSWSKLSVRNWQISQMNWKTGGHRWQLLPSGVSSRPTVSLKIRPRPCQSRNLAFWEGCPHFWWAFSALDGKRCSIIATRHWTYLLLTDFSYRHQSHWMEQFCQERAEVRFLVKNVILLFERNLVKKTLGKYNKKHDWKSLWQFPH